MFCFSLWLTSSHNNFKTYHHILQPYVKFEKKIPLILHYILVLYLGLVLEHWIKMCLSKVQMYMECSYLTSLWNKSSTDAWLKLGAILAALYFAEAEGIKKYINIIRYNLCQILLPKKKKKKKKNCTREGKDGFLFGYLNFIHPNINMHILHTVLYTFPKVLTRRICFTVKSFLSWLTFLFILVTLMFGSGVILKGGLRGHS